MAAIEMTANELSCGRGLWPLASNDIGNWHYHAIHAGLRQAALLALTNFQPLKYSELELVFSPMTMLEVGNSPEIYEYNRYYPNTLRGDFDFPVNLYGIPVVLDENAERGIAVLRRNGSGETLVRITEVT